MNVFVIQTFRNIDGGVYEDGVYSIHATMESAHRAFSQWESENGKSSTTKHCWIEIQEHEVLK